MLDRPSAPSTSRDAAGGQPAPRWPLAFLGGAGLLGAAGVAVGAAGAHLGGGDLARTASEFMLVHAAAVVAGAGVAFGPGRRSMILAVALALLNGGGVLFGGELAASALFDWRPVPLAAPLGGLCLIAGWLCLSAAAAALALVRR